MDDKVLIKSEVNKAAKIVMIAITGAIGGISLLIMLILAMIKPIKYNSYWGNSNYSSGFQAAFRGDEECLAFFIIACVLAVAAIVLLVMYLAHAKCELVITEKNVKGKSLFGKEVVLPLYMISAYSTKSLFSVISVATASGMTKFSFISNRAEIGEILSEKINERQTKTENELKTTPESNSMDDLVKLKSLLDSGIITQEEFDAKKKQLLGL